MRDKNQLQFPYSKGTRKRPVEVNPMHMGLRQRRVVPIEITEAARRRHPWYRRKLAMDALRALTA